MPRSPEEMRDLLRSIISYPPDYRRDPTPGIFWTLLIDRRRPEGCHVACLLSEKAVLDSTGLDTPYIIFYHDESRYPCHCEHFPAPEDQEKAFVRVNQFAVKAAHELTRRWPDGGYDASMHYQMLWFQVLHWAVDKVGRPRRADGTFPDFHPELVQDCSKLMFLSLCQDTDRSVAQEDTSAWESSLFFWIRFDKDQVRELWQRDWAAAVRAQETDYAPWAVSIRDQVRQEDRDKNRAGGANTIRDQGIDMDETVQDNGPSLEAIESLYRRDSYAQRLGHALKRNVKVTAESTAKPMGFLNIVRPLRNLGYYVRREINPYREYMTPEYLEDKKREQHTLDNIITRFLEESNI